MTVEAIGSVVAAPALAAMAPNQAVDGMAIAPAPAAGAGFGTWFANEVAAVNTGLVNADHAVHKLALGEGASLHQVMIDMEQAKLSFQLLAQVRNKMLEAYQEVMRMQV